MTVPSLFSSHKCSSITCFSFFQLHVTQYHIYTRHVFCEIAFDFLNDIASSAEIHSKFLIANETENIYMDYLCSQHYE